ncbi:MAG TPA: beta-xylosidase [Verrucomicrobiae bacterium]
MYTNVPLWLSWLGQRASLCATALGLACQAGASEPPASPGTNAPFPVAIRVDAGKGLGPLTPIWRFFGADEPNYATMKDGRKLLRELGQLRPNEVYFRAHNLLTSGDGTPALKWGSTGVYSEDTQGRAIYDWTILDGIFDAYVLSSVRPYVEIGFMPKDLSVKPDPYQHYWTPAARYEEIYTGWAYPPKDYGKWRELVFQWTKHAVERYGRAEVERWYWEVWNEPNIGYWRGSRAEFFRLHDHALAGVRRALPTARVGGPDVAGGPGGTFLREFLEHCLHGTNFATGAVGTPLDFVAFHAKGAPRFLDGHVRMGIANQLRDIDRAFAVIASFPELKAIPIVIGESDPDGCAACQGPQLGYRNTTMYSSYTAASFARKFALADRHGVNLRGALTWAFEFESQPWFAGFRVLASNGVDLPVLNVFRMFEKMAGTRMVVESSAETNLNSLLANGVREKPDVAALATLAPDQLAVMLWHYHDDDVPGPEASVEVRVTGLPWPAGRVEYVEYRVDAEHSNSYEAWKRMGSPQPPDPGQVVQLEKAGQLDQVGQTRSMTVTNGQGEIALRLPRQGVSLLILKK